MDEIEFSAPLVIQSSRPDPFFSAEQQERLSELMNLWRLAREQGQELPAEQKGDEQSCSSCSSTTMDLEILRDQFEQLLDLREAYGATQKIVRLVAGINTSQVIPNSSVE